MAANTKPKKQHGSEDEAAEGGILRSPMLDDGQPRFPLWLPLPGIALALVWAAYSAVSAEEAGGRVFLETALWPGAAFFLGTTIAAYFGWRLDLE